MKYRLLGKSGLKVSELALGAMTFGTETGIGVDKDESRKVYEHSARPVVILSIPPMSTTVVRVNHSSAIF